MGKKKDAVLLYDNIKLNQLNVDTSLRPAYSPNMSLVDNHFFYHFLGNKNFSKTSQIKDASRKVIRTLNEEFLRNQIIDRLSFSNKCTEDDGDYVN